SDIVLDAHDMLLRCVDDDRSRLFSDRFGAEDRPPEALRKRTAAKPASTEIPKNAAGCRLAKSVAPSTRSRKLPLRIFSAASSTYPAAELMPRAANGASLSKARAASRILPARRSTKSAPDRCLSRAWSSI